MRSIALPDPAHDGSGQPSRRRNPEMRSHVTLLPNARLRIGWQRTQSQGGLSAILTAAELEDYRRDVIRTDPLSLGGERLFLPDGRNVRAILHKVGHQDLRDDWAVVNGSLGALAGGDPVTVELGDVWDDDL
jgi:hypothetical protein